MEKMDVSLTSNLKICAIEMKLQILHVTYYEL